MLYLKLTAIDGSTLIIPERNIAYVEDNHNLMPGQTAIGLVEGHVKYYNIVEKADVVLGVLRGATKNKRA